MTLSFSFKIKSAGGRTIILLVSLCLLPVFGQQIQNNESTTSPSSTNLLPNCITYGSCGDETACVGTHGPRSVSSDHIDVLSAFCPEFLEQHSQTTPVLFCCDFDQVLSLGEKLGLASAIAGKCPSCLRNLRQMLCHLVCSPEQHEFMRVTETALSTLRDNVTNEFIPYAVKADIYLEQEYIDETFQSCKGVTAGSSLVMDIFCGKWKSVGCNPKRWFDFVGKASSGVVSFDLKINLVPRTIMMAKNSTIMIDLAQKGMTPFTFNATNCETAPPGETACECVDCDASCPYIPPPKQHITTSFLTSDGMLLLMGMIAGIGCVTIFVVTIVLFIRRQKAKKTSFSFVQEMQSKGDYSKQLDKDENKDSALHNFFRNVVFYSATNPWRVICTEILIICALSYGMRYSSLETDPVALWTPPNSRARLERDYFNERFGSIYRIEQIIIIAKNPLQNIINYTSPVEGEQSFGPILNPDFIRGVHLLESKIKEIRTTSGVTLDSVCFKPLSPSKEECMILSYLGWWQDSLQKLNLDETNSSSTAENYLDHFSFCSDNHYSPGCFGPYGGPISASNVLGGFNISKDGTPDFKTSRSVLVNYFISDFVEKEKNAEALEWETSFITFLKNFTENDPLAKDLFDVRFTSARSIEDEISAASRGEVSTIVISYLVMFIYISISLRESFSVFSLRGLFVESRLVLGVTGILVVLTSVSSAVGLFGYFGLPATLIIIEVIPFLVLAVGVDNIFIMVQHFQRSQPLPEGETLEDQLSRVVAEVGPSMVLNSCTDAACFFLGGMSGMPAVRALSYYAGVALIFNFFLQFTLFIAVFALDTYRIQDNRCDILFFIKFEKEKGDENLSLQRGKGILYRMFKNIWAPILLSYPIRVLVLVVFFTWACISLALVPRISVGLDPETILPEDSYVARHFQALLDNSDTGFPLWFVLKKTSEQQSQLDFADPKTQSLIRGSNTYSLVGQVHQASKYPNITYVAQPALSWLDSYIEWAGNDKCCRVNVSGKMCPSDLKESQKFCKSCRIKLEDGTLSRGDFVKYFPWFLKDNPSIECPKGGHALFAKAVLYNITTSKINNTTTLSIGDTFYMAFNSVLKKSKDFTQSMIEAREISNNISATMNTRANRTDLEVFPYSPVYIFYEQFLSIWKDTIVSISISFVTVTVMTWAVLGDPWASLLVLVNVMMIVADVGGIMFLCGISLNGVSLVNLVVAVGISVEFCTHILHAFMTCPVEEEQGKGRIGRARYSLINMGSSVLSGITLTKFVGIAVLAFCKSPAFRIFYFRMYLAIVVAGASHGLIFLPVLLSWVGPQKNKASS